MQYLEMHTYIKRSISKKIEIAIDFRLFNLNFDNTLLPLF
jgi:hypothetical protein